jgi:hypothetical protein
MELCMQASGSRAQVSSGHDSTVVLLLLLLLLLLLPCCCHCCQSSRQAEATLDYAMRYAYHLIWPLLLSVAQAGQGYVHNAGGWLDCS